MNLIRSFCFYGTMIAMPLFVNTAWSVEPINFEVRNNADLVAVCSTQTSDPNYVAAIHFCHGFAIGYYRYYESLMREGKYFNPIFCIPDGVTRNQAVSAFVSFSKAHPDYDQAMVGDAVMKFLVETYPCKSK